MAFKRRFALLKKEPGQLHSNSNPVVYPAITCKSFKPPSHSLSLDVFPTSLLFSFLTSLHRLASLSPRPCCLTTAAEPQAAMMTHIHSDLWKNRTESTEMIIWNGSESTRLLPRHMTAGLMGSCSARSLRSTHRPPDHIFVWFSQRWYVLSADQFWGSRKFIREV